MDMYLTPPVRSFEQAAGDVKLAAALKGAVNREKAPQYLINAIRLGIRG